MPQPRLHASAAARQAAYRRRQEQARHEELSRRGLPALPAIASMPGTQRWVGAICQASELLSSVVVEMQAYFDERSEQWQEDERGETHQQRIEALEEIVEALEGVWA